MSRRTAPIVVGVAAVVAAAVVVYAWRTTHAPEPEPVAEPVPVAASTVETPEDLHRALVDLFGRDAVLSLFTLDDFARRLAATVDNLGRAQASASVWPLHPAAGRFTVQTGSAGTVIGADNG